MTIHITAEPMSAEAFAPFGDLFPPAVLGQPERQALDELVNSRPAARLRLSFPAVRAQALPLQATMLERHIHSSQAFVPLDCAAYLVAVAPHGADGGPDLGRLRAFRVPGDTAINYKPDVWHHPITLLERDGRFLVVTFVDATAADQEIVPISASVIITA